MLRLASARSGSGVTVLSRNGAPVGGGLLLTPTRIATCAHVVAAALGSDAAATEPPAGDVVVGLHNADGTLRHRSARAVHWQPVRPDGTGDIVVLRLDDPEMTLMHPLYRLDRPWGRRFSVTAAYDDAGPPITVTGELRAVQGTGWTQLRSDAHGPPISAGFSGFPVWDEQLGAVIGLTVAADFNPRRATAYMIAIQDVCRLDPTVIRNPYRGLAPFREADAMLFSGRDSDVVRLADVLDRERFAVVVGPSGVGKSSLVRAGLVPRLRAARTRVVELPVDGDAALAALDAGFFHADEDVVVVADQFEEMLATEPTSNVRALLDRLGRLADETPRRVRVVMTLRWTDLGEVVAASTARRIDAGTVPVAPLSRPQLRDAIALPAAWAPGLEFESGLIEQICDDAEGGPGRLPLVAMVLRQMAAGPADGVMTRDAYARLGGVSGAIERLGDGAVADLGDERPHVRGLLTGLVRLDDTGFVRRRRRLGDLTSVHRRIAEMLVERRLLVVSADPEQAADEASVELAHQSVIEHWPALRDWLEEDRAYLGWLAEMTRRQAAWSEAGRHPGALLRGAGLATAREWLAVRPDTDSDLREYVVASATRAGFESKRRNLLVAVVAIAIGAAVVLGSLAAYQRSVADAHETASGSRQLAALSTTTATSDPSFSALLALAAYRRQPTDEARQALFHHHVEYLGAEAVLSGGFGRINAVDASADARVVTANTGTGVMTVWDRRAGDGVTVGRLPADGNVTSFRVTANGGTVHAMETFAIDSHVVFGHDLASGERTWEVALDTVVDTVTLGDERFAVILAGPAGESRTQQLWDVSGQRPRLVGERTEPGRFQEIHGFGPEPGAVVLRSLSDDGGLDLEVWDAVSGGSRQIAEGVVPAGLGYWLDGQDRVSPTGTTVLCDDRAGRLRLISVVDGSTVGDAPLPPAGSCRDIVVDDLATVAVGNTNAVTLSNGQVVRQPGPHPFPKDDLTQVDPLQRSRRLANDGERLLTLLHDSQRVIVTEVDLEAPVGEDQVADAGSDSTVDPAGRWRAEQVATGRFEVSAMPGPEPVAQIAASAVAFDGDLLVTASEATISWWDPATLPADSDLDWFETGSERPVGTLHLGYDANGVPRDVVALSPDGEAVIRAANTVATVSLRPEDWVETVCASVERATFTEAERTTLPGWAYAEPLC